MRGPPNRHGDRKSRKEEEEGERLALYNRRTLHSSGNFLAPIGSEPHSTSASQTAGTPNGRVAKSKSRENNPKKSESNSRARKSNTKSREVNPYAREVKPNTRLANRKLRTDNATERAVNPTPRAAEKISSKNDRNILEDHLDEKYRHARAVHDGKAPSSHSRPSSTMQARMRPAAEAVPLVSRGVPCIEVMSQRKKINLDLPIEKPKRKPRFLENVGAKTTTPSRRVKREIKLSDKANVSGKKVHPAIEEARRLKEELLGSYRTKNNNSSSTAYETVHHITLPHVDINHVVDAKRKSPATCCDTKMAEIVQQQTATRKCAVPAISATSGIAARDGPLGSASDIQKLPGVTDSSTYIREFSVSPECVPLGRCSGSVALDIKSEEVRSLRSSLRKSTVLPRTEAILSQREKDTNTLPPSRNAVIETINDIKRKRQVYTPCVLEFIKSKRR